MPKKNNHCIAALAMTTVFVLFTQPTFALTSVISPPPVAFGTPAAGRLQLDYGLTSAGQFVGGLGSGVVVSSSRVSSGQFVLTSAHTVTAENQREIGFNSFNEPNYVGNTYVGFQSFPGLAIVSPSYAPGNGTTIPPANDLAILLTESVPVSPLSLAATPPPIDSFPTLTGAGNTSVPRSAQFHYVGGDAANANRAVFVQGPYYVERGDSGGPYLSNNKVFAIQSSDYGLASEFALAERVDLASPSYSGWINTDVISDLKPAQGGIFGYFTDAQVKPSKVLNANYPGQTLNWEVTTASVMQSPYQVLGLFNNESLDLLRERIYPSEGSGAESNGNVGTGSSTPTPEMLIVGESGTYNGTQGYIDIYNGTFSTRSMRNNGTIHFEAQDDPRFLYTPTYPSRLEVTGPLGFLNDVHGIVTGEMNMKLGTSVYKGACFNRGVISPGSSPGHFKLDGNFVQDSIGTLQMELGGLPDDNYDQVIIDGSAVLGGTLDIRLVRPYSGYPIFSPSAGNSFTIISATDGLTGTFQNVLLPSLSPSLAWDIRFLTNTVQLSVLGPALIPGDYDRNGTVDTLDYLMWKREFGLVGSLAADGNSNGKVDAGDFVVWRKNFGAGIGTNIGAHASAPEPTSAFLLVTASLVGICGMTKRRRIRNLQRYYYQTTR